MGNLRTRCVWLSSTARINTFRLQVGLLIMTGFDSHETNTASNHIIIFENSCFRHNRHKKSYRSRYMVSLTVTVMGNNANIDTKCTPGFRVGCILLCPGCIFNGWGASCRSMNTEPFELHPDIHFVREDQQRRMPLELCKQ